MQYQSHLVVSQHFFVIAVVGATDTDTSNTGSVTLDFAGTNQNFVLTFTGNVTLANPSTEAVGQSGIIVCIQDGTGSRTLSLGTDYETAGGSGITLSTAASSVDVIPYFVKASGSIQLGVWCRNCVSIMPVSRNTFFCNPSTGFYNEVG